MHKSTYALQAYVELYSLFNCFCTGCKSTTEILQEAFPSHVYTYKFRVIFQSFSCNKWVKSKVLDNDLLSNVEICMFNRKHEAFYSNINIEPVVQVF